MLHEKRKKSKELVIYIMYEKVEVNQENKIIREFLKIS